MSPAASEDRGLASLRSSDDDPEPDLRLAAVLLRRCSADRRSRPDCWRWPNRKVFAFLAGCVRRDKNLAGCSRFHRADRGMARRPARSRCCATSHTSDKQCLRPRFWGQESTSPSARQELARVEFKQVWSRGTCRFATDAGRTLSRQRRNDIEIAKLLQQFGRSGVPL